MKTIGQLAKEFRKKQEWGYTRMAQEVSRFSTEPVSRQAITQLEAAGNRKPHYIAALATLMGTSADALLAGVETGQALPAAVPVRQDYAALANSLRALSPAARDRAAVLLQGMAKDPDGPWATWLTELLENPSPTQGEAEPVQPGRYEYRKVVVQPRTATKRKAS